MNGTSDIQVYLDLVELLNKDEMDEVRRGGHFILDDQGYYALLWRGLPGARVRFNSHPYDGDAFSIQGGLYPEFLCSTLQVERKNYTWFQVERAGIRTPGQFSRHAVHWMFYMVADRNVGPDGTSIHTHKRPIRIDAERIEGPKTNSLKNINKW